MLEQLPGVLGHLVHVVQYVLGLCDQLMVGIAHTQSQASHPVQQWSQLAGLLKFNKSFLDRSI